LVSEKSHLHRDSDEVAWMLSGEIAFKIGDDVTVGGPGTRAFFPRNVPHAWKNTGSETGRVLFPLHPGHRRPLRRGALVPPRPYPRR
jgi:quercetin dioxygenase-like cupin family protein